VIVDARLARRRTTGVATYINELRAALGPASRSRVHFAYGPPGLPRRNRVTRIANLALDLAWLHVGVPLLALRRRAAVIHAPVNWLPWWSPSRTVVTVQDLAWERIPESYPRFFRAYARLFARRSVARADVVLATSRSTADDLVELYGVARERVRIVPIGVHPDSDPPREREPFVLHVGEFEPRKRVLELIEGHRRYLERAPADPPPCRLVLAGSGGAQQEAVRTSAGPGCELVGFVSDAELSELYRRAALVVVPSRYEGFGLPVAEALAHGCPVMVAANSSLAEVGGESAILLADPSPEGIAAALLDALQDRRVLADRGRAGWEDVRGRLSWETAARLTEAAYREAVA
jgi:glycosyltransferase involved in cell wall biosynthesis